jgi:hypothetical protein
MIQGLENQNVIVSDNIIIKPTCQMTDQGWNVNLIISVRFC